MFALYGQMTTHPGQREALIGHLLQAAEVLRGLEGCHLYIINRHAEQPDTVTVFELWRSADDHRASLQLDAVQALIKAAGPLLATSPQGSQLEPVGGVGFPQS